MSLRRFTRFVLFCAPLLIVPMMVSASIDANSTGLVEAGRAAGLSSICSNDASACIATLVGKFLNMALGFIGLILFCYIVYGGVLYMSAAGDTKQVTAAKDTLRNAIIGVFLIVLAFGISSFVIDRAIEVVNTNQVDGSGGGGEGGAGGGTGGTAGTPGSGGSTTAAPGTVAACNLAYPPRTFFRGDCAGCQGSCLNILCRVGASDAASDPAPPPPDSRNRGYTFPADAPRATTECLTRCRASADCPAS